MADQDLTAQFLRELIEYNPDTGVFTWKPRDARHFKSINAWGMWNTRFGGKRAGGKRDKEGKCGFTIRICDRPYLAHRLAWFYMIGEWPSSMLDHRNGHQSDNRWTNLRLANHRLNAENKRSARSDNVCGVLGVSQRHTRFHARIGHHGKSIHLGCFESKELAHAAYLDAKRRIHLGCTI